MSRASIRSRACVDDVGFAKADEKMETGFGELRSEMKAGFEKADKKMDAGFERFDKKFDKLMWRMLAAALSIIVLMIRAHGF